MGNRYQIINIDKQYNNIRLDKFLFTNFTNVNNILIQKAIRNKDILLNGETIKYDTKLEFGNQLNLSNFISKIFNQPSRIVKNKKELKFTDKEIEKVKSYVIYKDDNLLAINKPNGLAVQSGTKIQKSLNDYLEYLKYDNDEIPRLVHRIDKDTSGVLLVARNKKTTEILNEYFKERNGKLEKIYLAVVIGKFAKQNGVINYPLLKKVENGIEKVYKDEKNGKQAITFYKVIKYFEKYNVSLLEIKILTGRTHQIRVHLKELGHPILGDGKYGGKNAFVNGLSDKLHLHSYIININDLLGKKISIKAEPSKYFNDFY